MSKPTIICLTPVKNEAWILDRFLKCASLWADKIIIADQNSSDGSREIAISYPKVTLIDNLSSSFNEPERQKILIEEARKIPGKRILIALDADEALTANFMDSSEWKTLLDAPTGTVFKFQWANLRPDLQTYWSISYYLPLGFMDDGSEHVGSSIHSTRIPFPNKAPSILLQNIKVLHYQYTDWERMQSKHRWYQCWERLNNSHRSAIDIYRQYHHMDVIPPSEIKPVSPEWFDTYTRQGIDMTSTRRDGSYWWDGQVLDFFEKYGTEKFKLAAIWDVNWEQIAEALERDTTATSYADPRNRLDKIIHKWLKKTQPKPSYQRTVIESILSLFVK
jgi:glycosyltransferase involved in cell wall biosynthesis